MARCTMNVTFTNRANGEKTLFEGIDVIAPYAGPGGYPGLLLRRADTGEWINLDMMKYNNIDITTTIDGRAPNDRNYDVSEAIRGCLHGYQVKETLCLMDATFIDERRDIEKTYEELSVMVSFADEDGQGHVRFNQLGEGITDITTDEFTSIHIDAYAERVIAPPKIEDYNFDLAGYVSKGDLEPDEYELGRGL